MEVLTGKLFGEALIACREVKGTKIGIACATSMSASVMIESIWSELTNGRMPGWEMGRWVHGDRATLRKKVDGEYSTIDIFAPHDVTDIRGMSYNKVLYEEYIDRRLLDELIWCERIPVYEPVDEDSVNESLDEFLNSFKIV